MVLDKTVDMMLSDDPKERIKAEYHQLTYRVNKLQKMIREYKNNKRDCCHKCSLDLLLWQLKAMQEYQYVLKRRCEVENIKLY